MALARMKREKQDGTKENTFNNIKLSPLTEAFSLASKTFVHNLYFLKFFTFHSFFKNKRLFPKNSLLFLFLYLLIRSNDNGEQYSSLCPKAFLLL